MPPATSQPQQSRKRRVTVNTPWRRRYRAFRRRVGGKLLHTLGPAALVQMQRTWKQEFVGQEHMDALVDGGPFLIALWHGRMMLGLPAHADRNWQVLVSPSDDGSVIVPLLDRFGYGVVRGSASRGGARATREMLAAIQEEGQVVIVTPDGPRGPRHSTNPGLAWLARETGVPILPISLVCDRSWHLNSWDRFTIPRPGARILTTYSEPVVVPEGTPDDGLEAFTDTVAERLVSGEARGFETLGVPSDHDS